MTSNVEEKARRAAAEAERKARADEQARIAQAARLANKRTKAVASTTGTNG